jgi:hypothetical protein
MSENTPTQDEIMSKDDAASARKRKTTPPVVGWIHDASGGLGRFEDDTSFAGRHMAASNP